MNEEKFVQSDTKYLDLAKNVTSLLHDLCINGNEEYNVLTVIAGISVGVYMFFRELSNMIEAPTKDLISECVRWIDWADSKFNKTN